MTALLFDPEWYLQHYEDVAKARLDPVQHYLDHGAREGRNPNALFDTTWYLAANADVRASPLNPFLHFILYGFREGRDPGPPVAAPAASADRVPSGSTTQATIVEAPDETLRQTLLAAMFAAADANEGDAQGRTTGGNPTAAAPAGLPAKKAGRSRPGTRKTP